MGRWISPWAKSMSFEGRITLTTDWLQTELCMMWHSHVDNYIWPWNYANRTFNNPWLTNSSKRDRWLTEVKKRAQGWLQCETACESKNRENQVMRHPMYTLTLHASRFTLHAFCFKRHMGDRMNITIHKYANSYHCNISQKKLVLTMTSFSLLTSVCAERKLLTAFNRETLRILGRVFSYVACVNIVLFLILCFVSFPSLCREGHFSDLIKFVSRELIALWT